ncbi:MAG: tyrosine--tRNA ligase [Candidatus Levybacteria bacterium]|nr:tyrosine--tRNA ligase [Candidatus Levybacteria bacterium]
MDQIDEVLHRGVANIISNKESLKSTLNSGKSLNVYLGIDPTATRIHLGHTVPLRKIQALAELGHNVTFLIGDFTSLIGDTSDKDSERPILTVEQIEENFQTYKKQAEKILDFSKITVKHNREWLSQLKFEDVVKIAQHFSVGDFVGRELVRKRLEENKRVGLHEFLYPVMQGYDSYFLDTDIQIGGTDQTFNMQAGRTLQKDLRDKESYVLTTTLLEGTDGRKMSKSWGNAIWLEDEPSDMYAKVMAIRDDLIIKYYTLATDTPMEEIFAIEKDLANNDRPMEIKKKLAERIVTELHGTDQASSAGDHFQRTVQNKEISDEVVDLNISESTIIDENFLLAQKIVASKSEGKQLIAQGGVTLNGEKVTGLEQGSKNDIIKVGKRRVFKL